MRVTNVERTRWGNYSDRVNSFDDSTDIEKFIELAKKNEDLRYYLRAFVGKGSLTFRPHFFGKYGVDLTLVNEYGTPVADIDIERWSQWHANWPEHYKHIHFLGRKEKYLSEDRPFFMVYMNYPRTQCLILSKEIIQLYPTIDKKFKTKNITDRVKEIPLSEGRVFV